MNLNALTSGELERINRENVPVFFPLGSSEQHGPHLPLGTKGFLAEAIAFEALKLLKAKGVTPLVAPTFNFAPCHVSFGIGMNFPIGARTFSDLVFEVGQAFQREGFKWFFLVNTMISPETLRGIEVALNDLNRLEGFQAFDPLPAWVFSHKPKLEPLLQERGLNPDFELHADVKETSALLSLDESLVKTESLPSLPPFRVNSSVQNLKGNFTFKEMGAESGYLGSPASAGNEIGEVYLGEAGLSLAESVISAMRGEQLPGLPLPIRMLIKMVDLDEL